MPGGQQSSPELKRVALACHRCRNSKLKCSGTKPCDRCAQKARSCIYDDPFNHNRTPGTSSSPGVVQQLTTSGRTPQSNKRPRNEEAEPTLPSLRSQAPVENPATYQRNRPDKRRRWLYLGTSSTASFNVRVAALLQAATCPNGNGDAVTFTLDGDAYKISWDRVRSDDLPELTDLPSLDYAVYLTNTVKFHLGSLFRLFDEEEFLANMHELYADAPAKVESHRIWFTQYLLIMALGKGLLNSRRSPGSVAGSDFFCRAMSILPETATLHEEPVLAAEVLCLVALYFYCLDMRQTAYSYMGQALRIALVEGMHTYLEGSQLGEKLARRCANLWWTVYILDRTLSSVVGVPPSVTDGHVKTSLPEMVQSSQRTATLGLHVKLSRLVSDILTELYSVDGSLETSYLLKTRSILRDMARVAEQIEETIDFKFKNSLETVSKGATHLRLMYHQEKLKSIFTQIDGQLGVLRSVQDLLQACVESATKTLRMLLALSKNNMLDCFLPFDLDFACAAASILVLVDDILQCVAVNPHVKMLADKILDEMVDAGNNAASLRKNELQQLRRLAQMLKKSSANGAVIRDRLSQTGNGDVLDSTEESDSRPMVNGDNLSANNTASEPVPVDETRTPVSTGTSQDLAQNFDLSHEQMLVIADQLDVNAFTSSFEFHDFGRLDWLEL